MRRRIGEGESDDREDLRLRNVAAAAAAPWRHLQSVDARRVADSRQMLDRRRREDLSQTGERIVAYKTLMGKSVEYNICMPTRESRDVLDDAT